MTFSILLIFISVLIAMIIHEVSHGLVAYLLGDDTAKIDGRLSLNPVNHLDPFMSIILPILCVLSNIPIVGGAKSIPVNGNKLRYKEFGMALVALAGPISNLILSFLAFFIFWSINIQFGPISSFFIIFIKVNISLAAFNLIPLPPLDGSRIVYALAPNFIKDLFDDLESKTWLSFILIILFSTQISSFILLVQSSILSLYIAIFS